MKTTLLGHLLQDYDVGYPTAFAILWHRGYHRNNAKINNVVSTPGLCTWPGRIIAYCSPAYKDRHKICFSNSLRKNVRNTVGEGVDLLDTITSSGYWLGRQLFMFVRRCWMTTIMIWPALQISHTIFLWSPHPFTYHKGLSSTKGFISPKRPCFISKYFRFL